MEETKVTIIIEIPKNSNVKYEYDHETQKLICDRILHTAMIYFFNYGYIENTISGDGDPLDAVVLCDASLYPKCHIDCKPIGVINTTDEKGDDPKIILVPVASVDPDSEYIDDIKDLKEPLIKKLKHFFENYKTTEKGKWVKVSNILGKEEALKIINDSKKKISTDI